MGAQMSNYRVYVIGEDNRIVERIELNCANDSAAIEYAKQYINRKDIELWQRDRRIARFDILPKDTMGWLKGELGQPD
jgi:hypothetical protein